MRVGTGRLRPQRPLVDLCVLVGQQIVRSAPQRSPGVPSGHPADPDVHSARDEVTTRSRTRQTTSRSRLVRTREGRPRLVAMASINPAIKAVAVFTASSASPSLRSPYSRVSEGSWPLPQSGPELLVDCRRPHAQCRAVMVTSVGFPLCFDQIDPAWTCQMGLPGLF